MLVYRAVNLIYIDTTFSIVTYVPHSYSELHPYSMKAWSGDQAMMWGIHFVNPKSTLTS